MLKNQLNALKRQKTTNELTHVQKLSFITEEIDTDSLLDYIPFSTEYTTLESLRFERDMLSEKEEKKFNKKFSKFLIASLPKMNEQGVEYFLEYLVRIYNVHLFNSDELLYLLVPYKQYYCHILQFENYFNERLCGNICLSTFVSLIIKDRFVCAFFKKYFLYRDFVKDFLDLIAKEVYLVDNNNSFIKMYEQNFSIKLNDKKIQIEKKNLTLKKEYSYYDIYEEGKDKSLLCNTKEMIKYFEWLDLNKKVSKVFVKEEVEFIKIVLNNEEYDLNYEFDYCEVLKCINCKVKAFLDMVEKLKTTSVKYFYILNKVEQLKVIEKIGDKNFILEILTENNFGFILKDNFGVLNDNAVSILYKNFNFANPCYNNVILKVLDEGNIKQLIEKGKQNRKFITSFSEFCIFKEIDITLFIIGWELEFAYYLTKTKYGLHDKSYENIFTGIDKFEVANVFRIFDKSPHEYKTRFIELLFSDYNANTSNDGGISKNYNIRCIIKGGLNLEESNDNEKMNILIIEFLENCLDLLEIEKIEFVLNLIGRFKSKILARKYFSIKKDEIIDYFKIDESLDANLFENLDQLFDDKKLLLPYIDKIYAVCCDTKTKENYLFTTELLLFSIELENEVEKAANYIISNINLFLCLTHYVNNYFEIVEILLNEGIRTHKAFANLIYDELMVNYNEHEERKYLIAAFNIKEEVDVVDDHILFLCNNINNDSLGILSFFVLKKREDFDFIPFLSSIVAAVKEDEERKHVKLLKFLIRKYKNLLQPYVLDILVYENSLIEIMKKKLESRIVVNGCADVFKKTKDFFYINNIVELMENVNLNQTIEDKLTSLIEYGDIQYIQLCVELLNKNKPTTVNKICASAFQTKKFFLEMMNAIENKKIKELLIMNVIEPVFAKLEENQDIFKAILFYTMNTFNSKVSTRLDSKKSELCGAVLQFKKDGLVFVKLMVECRFDFVEVFMDRLMECIKKVSGSTFKNYINIFIFLLEFSNYKDYQKEINIVIGLLDNIEEYKSVCLKLKRMI